MVRGARRFVGHAAPTQARAARAQNKKSWGVSMAQQAKVILATDLSDNAKAAAEWAAAFGQTEDAEVVVVHVVEISAAHWAAGAYDFLDDDKLRGEAETNVHKWYVDATGSEPKSVQVRAGTPAVQLAEAVSEEKADYLVVARSGKRGWERFWLGSTAKALAIDPPCQVVIVHPEHSKARVRNLVVGTDFSNNADRAVSEACALARRYGAKLHIVHAEEVERIDAIDALGGATIPSEYRRTDTEIDADKRMKQLEKDHASELEDIHYDTKLTRETPAKALIDYCEKNKTDVLVVGRAGHSPLLTHVLGSVVNRVVQGAPTTVIITPVS